MRVIFGDIIFEESPRIAKVMHVSGFLDIPKNAECFADELVCDLGDYIIPETYDGEIQWMCDTNIDIDLLSKL